MLISKIRNKIMPRSKQRRFVFLRKPVYFGRHPQSDFLILTTGPTLGKCHKDIQKFIDKKGSDLKVMVCNFDDGMFNPDYRIIVNRRRFCTYANSSHNEVLLIPPYFAKWVIKGVISDRYYEEVMFKNVYFSEKGLLTIDEKGIIYTKAGTLATIALGVVLVMGAKNVFFAGLDGFSIYQPDNIHFFHDDDSIPFERRLMQEKTTHDMLGQAEEILKERGGQLKILTPTVYKKYYDESIL